MAQTPIRFNIGYVGVTPEVTPGTYVAPAVSDLIQAYDVSWEPEAEMVQRNDMRPHYGKNVATTGARKGKISFKYDLRAPGAGASPGVAPEIGDALKACCMSETVVAVTSVTYKPASLSSTYYSITVDRNQVSGAGKTARYCIAGALGTVKFMIEAGKNVVADFSFTGAYVAPVDTTLLVPTSQDSTTPPAALGVATVFLGAAAGLHAMRTLSFDVNTINTYRPDIGSASGYVGVFNGDRRPTAAAEIETPLVAADDIFGDWLVGTVALLDSGVIGGGAGTRIQLKSANARLTKLGVNNAEGRAVTPAEFELTVPAAGADGDDFSLIYS